MAIQYEILYQDSAVQPGCGNTNAVTVHLVQDSIVKHPTATSHFVDTIYVYYSGTDAYPQFTLTMLNDEYDAGDVRPVVTQGDSRDAASIASGPTRVENEDKWVTVFNAPSGSPSSVTFYFGVGAPPTKVKVVIKKQEDAPAPCP